MKISFVLTAAIIFTAGPTLGQEISPADGARAASEMQVASAPAFYQHHTKRLSKVGYRSFRSLNNAGTRIAAFDEQGSAVTLLLHPDSGKIERITYIHYMDSGAHPVLTGQAA